LPINLFFPFVKEQPRFSPHFSKVNSCLPAEALAEAGAHLVFSSRAYRCLWATLFPGKKASSSLPQENTLISENNCFTTNE